MTWIGHVLPCGEEALLIEVSGLDEVLDLAAAVRAAIDTGVTGFARVVDVVPAATTVLLTVAEPRDLGRLSAALDTLQVAPEGRTPATPVAAVEIAVSYDGPDLEAVAAHTSMSPAEVVAAHTGKPWRVAFGGFAPGFSYLAGGDDRLQVPRRDEPRTSVPAGAVGLAGEFSAVYPRSSPGGWQLIGQTAVTMWDVDREPPALLQPGAVVRFVDALARS